MISIRCPDDDAETIFKSAAARTRNKDLRKALLALSSRVGERADEYLDLAGDERLFELEAEDPVGVTKLQLYDVYDRVLVNGGERPVYNRLKSGAKFRLCPLCGERDVKTLDHYLVKTEFPEFAVFPANLIPSCSDCNKTKLAHVARRHRDQTFHPYFDDWSLHQILRASVDVGDTVRVRFSIEPVAGFSGGSLARARFHFEALQLGVLYASKAAVELVESKDTFRRNFLDGVEILKQELRLEALSRARGNLNGWRSVLYRGLSESNDFCNGGFELIEE